MLLYLLLIFVILFILLNIFNRYELFQFQSIGPTNNIKLVKQDLTNKYNKKINNINKTLQKSQDTNKQLSLKINNIKNIYMTKLNAEKSKSSDCDLKVQGLNVQITGLKEQIKMGKNKKQIL